MLNLGIKIGNRKSILALEMNSNMNLDFEEFRNVVSDIWIIPVSDLEFGYCSSLNG